VSVHVVGVLGLVVIFVVGTLRPINLGALALVMTFLVGSIAVGESAREMFSGFPVDLVVLLVGVTYLFGVAASNGTVERIVEGAARLVQGRRALIPWIVFVVASMPAMAGALGSAGVAMLAPLAIRLAERYDIDRRMIGLMVVHGAAAGNFSPLNVLGAIVVQTVEKSGLEMSVSGLFFANLGYNLVLAAVIFVVYGGLRPPSRQRRLGETSPEPKAQASFGVAARAKPPGLTFAQIVTLVALVVVAIAAFRFGLNIGFVALTAAVGLQLLFPSSSVDAEKKIAWSVVLLVAGIVTYVAALQRYGTVAAVGGSIAGLGSPLMTGLLICAIAAVTSAFASSAGILGAMIPLAVPLMAGGEIGTTGLVIAIALSATVVDATPFSTVGALVVANGRVEEQPMIYRGLLIWGAVMVLTSPIITWLMFILPSA
jgi:di/tricarboxylate transporter